MRGLTEQAIPPLESHSFPSSLEVQPCTPSKTSNITDCSARTKDSAIGLCMMTDSLLMHYRCCGSLWPSKPAKAFQCAWQCKSNMVFWKAILSHSSRAAVTCLTRKNQQPQKKAAGGWNTLHAAFLWWAITARLLMQTEKQHMRLHTSALTKDSDNPSEYWRAFAPYFGRQGCWQPLGPLKRLDARFQAGAM